MEIIGVKNVALELPPIPMIDSTAPESFKTGLSVTATGYYKDGTGSWTSLSISDTVTEISTLGIYELSLTATENNHDLVMIKLSATGAADNAILIRNYSVDIDHIDAQLADIDTEVDAVYASLLNIALTGAAINAPATSYTLTTGTQTSGTYVNTAPLDGVYHIHADSAGTLDLYYEFAVGGDGVPTGVTNIGYLTGLNDSIKVYAYNWGTTSWDQVGTLTGAASTANVSTNFSLYTTHVGTGANLGTVRIRYYNTGLSTAALGIDQLYVSYAIVSRSVGYSQGAIWIDSTITNTSTEPYVDGVADNPVSTWTAAKTLSSALNIKNFHVAPGSSITFDSAVTGLRLEGWGWELDLGGQVLTDLFLSNVKVIGTSTSGGITVYDTCLLDSGGLDNFTVGPSYFLHCYLAGTVTLNSTGTYIFDACASAVAGGGTPVIDFNSAGVVALNIRHYSGGVQFDNMTSDHVVSLEGHGQVVFDSSCTGGEVYIRGHFTVTDNSGGLVTIVDNANFKDLVITHGLAQSAGNNYIQLAATASATDGAYDPATIFIYKGTGVGQTRNILQYDGTTKIATVDRNWKMNPDSTSGYRIVADAGREHINEGLAQAGGSTTITLNTLASSSNDAYINQLVFIRSGTGEDQVRHIVDYDGTTKVATVSEVWDITPDSTSGYVVLPAHVHEPSDTAALVQVDLAAALTEIKGATWSATTDTLEKIRDAIIADATAANQATIIAYVDELETRLTAVRAGYLDNLNGVATLAKQNTIQLYVDELESLLKNSTYGLAALKVLIDAVPNASEINAEVVDAVTTEAITELTGEPGATPTLSEAIMFLYMWLRNAGTATNALTTIKNNAGTTIASQVISDDGVTFTKNGYS